MNIKNLTFLLCLVVLAVSCDDNNNNDNNAGDNYYDDSSESSTLTELSYPVNQGTSGDTLSLLGYGYDATGLCDTTSVRAKVFGAFNRNYIFHGNPYSSVPILVSGSSFYDLQDKTKKVESSKSGYALVKHMEALLKLAFNTDTVHNDYAYVYYAAMCYTDHYYWYFMEEKSQDYLNNEFKNDILTFSPEEIVRKYGTHVLTGFYLGAKLEALYRCKFITQYSDDACERLFYRRMVEFMGGAPGFYMSGTRIPSQIQERLIYNSTGNGPRLCGMLHTTDFNPGQVSVNASNVFGENCPSYFIGVDEEGLIPIYDLIQDEAKKQELKAYIEEYLFTPYAK